MRVVPNIVKLAIRCEVLPLDQASPPFGINQSRPTGTIKHS
jgi:hypothetical protein